MLAFYVFVTAYLVVALLALAIHACNLLDVRLEWVVVLRGASIYGNDHVLYVGSYADAEKHVDDARGMTDNNLSHAYRYTACTGIYMKPRVTIGRGCAPQSRIF